MFLKRSDFPNCHAFEFTVRPLEVSANHRGTPSHHRFLPGIKTLAMAFALLFAVLYETGRHGTGRFRSLGNMDNTDIIVDELCCVMFPSKVILNMLNCGASILAATISPARVHGHIFDMSLHIYSVMLRYYWKHMWCCIGVQISPETFLFGSPHCTNLDLENTWLPSVGFSTFMLVCRSVLCWNIIEKLQT